MRRALNIRALSNKTFFTNLRIPSLIQLTLPRTSSRGARLCGCRWLPQTRPCTSGTRTLTPPSRSLPWGSEGVLTTLGFWVSTTIFLAEPSTALVTCTEHKLFVRCVSHRGRVHVNVTCMSCNLWSSLRLCMRHQYCGEELCSQCHVNSTPYLTQHTNTLPLTQEVRVPHTTLFSATSL